MALVPHFTTLGSGPTVVLLHDADGDHLTFAPQVETLAHAGYRAVAWDMPGYGRSSPIEPVSFKGLAQSCQALLEALQVSHVALVGHGMGAMVALEVALRHPTRVRQLALCAGGPALDAQAQADWVQPRLDALEAHSRMEAVAALLVPRFIGTGALPEGVRLASHAMGQVYAATYWRTLQALAGFDRGREAFSQLHMPSLLVSGGDDRCTPPAAMEALALVMPDAQHVSLPHVGHWPQLEDPDGFDGLLLDFLAQRRTLH